MEKLVEEKVQKITPIKTGTVIDHIPPNTALKVLRILGLPGDHDAVISIGMNVLSKKLAQGKKDIIKVEDMVLDQKLINKIALIAPKATIVRIKDTVVTEKFQVELSPEIVGIVKCPNMKCISNTREPVQTKFRVLQKAPVKIQCEFCDRILFFDEILELTS
ncbi:MAG: aspartate carbamoyltransferase regulatory subunit [Promethearchaeota archaeon]